MAVDVHFQDCGVVDEAIYGRESYREQHFKPRALVDNGLAAPF
jgi:hypothetical protein